MRYIDFAQNTIQKGVRERLLCLIDLSPSMDDEDWQPSRRAGAVKANIELIKTKAQNNPDDIVGIIGFGSEAMVLHDPVTLKGNINSLCNSIKQTPDPWGTDFTAALELAQECFFGSSPPGSTERKGLLRVIGDMFFEPVPNIQCKNISGDSSTNRIIMLTDGGHNGSGDPVDLAQQLKSSSVIIDCIGIGGTPKDVDEEMLKAIASRNRDGSIRYCFIGDKGQLIQKYQTLAARIQPV